ncbi:ABC transporter ATP-binding protein [Streptomyces tritici]|uniref:ABC transporter ATP-binding protein n=1 Tax=Streptomyces tritici TaxID=2054410 RepID=UPI003AF071E6
MSEVTATASAGAPAGTDADGRAVVELAGVTRTYPGSPPVHAVREVSLRIGRGELVAVVGPSGSGKSTLLNLIGTLDRPSSGRVRIAGYDVDRLSDRELSALRAEHIGFVFQQFFLTPGVSAVGNVAEGLLYTGLSRRDRIAAATEGLRRVGLGHRLTHRPHELSGGERQRVALARAVAGRPSLLLADEPTGSLDTASGAAVVELLRELHADGTTVVVITHDTELAARLPRRVTMRDGALVTDEREAAPLPGTPGRAARAADGAPGVTAPQSGGRRTPPGDGRHRPVEEDPR